MSDPKPNPFKSFLNEAAKDALVKEVTKRVSDSVKAAKETASPNKTQLDKIEKQNDKILSLLYELKGRL